MNLLQQIKQSKLYPLFFLLKFPFWLPRLIANEGFGGAIRWSLVRFHTLFARVWDRSAGFYEQPIKEFKSKLGFSLIRRAELLVYDEIFLDRCYDFTGFPELLKQRPLHVLDFGMHHGLFMDYVLTLNRDAEIYGAEMSPDSFAVTRERFAGQKKIHLRQVAIGGTPRRLKVGSGTVSVEQSIYMEQKDGLFDVEVVTPLAFLHHWELPAKRVTLLKMDIEGAEREVFENPASIKPILQATQAFVIEIHSEADVELITRMCTDSGLGLVERRGINFFFRRK